MEPCGALDLFFTDLHVRERWGQSIRLGVSLVGEKSHSIDVAATSRMTGHKRRFGIISKLELCVLIIRIVNYVLVHLLSQLLVKIWLSQVFKGCLAKDGRTFAIGFSLNFHRFELGFFQTKDRQSFEGDCAVFLCQFLASTTVNWLTFHQDGVHFLGKFVVTLKILWRLGTHHLTI